MPAIQEHVLLNLKVNHPLDQEALLETVLSYSNVYNTLADSCKNIRNWTYQVDYISYQNTQLKPPQGLMSTKEFQHYNER